MRRLYNERVPEQLHSCSQNRGRLPEEAVAVAARAPHRSVSAFQAAYLPHKHLAASLVLCTLTASVRSKFGAALRACGWENLTLNWRNAGIQPGLDSGQHRNPNTQAIYPQARRGAAEAQRRLVACQGHSSHTFYQRRQRLYVANKAQLLRLARSAEAVLLSAATEMQTLEHLSLCSAHKVAHRMAFS